VRTRAGAILTGLALVAAVAGIAVTPASGQTTPTEQQFGGYGTGTVIGLNALGIGSTTTANIQAAHSAGVVNSKGLTTSTNDELGQNINPPKPTKDAYGRGSGVEIGLLTGSIQGVDVNQIILSQLAEADAPPPTGPVIKNIPINIPGVLSATTAGGEARATFDANSCVVGRPITHGRGFVENLQVLPQGTTGVVATNTAGDNVNESRTVTYLVPNGDGTFGMVAETHLHVAPTQLLNGALILQIAGPIIMRVIATGKPGGARIEYPGTPVLSLSTAGGVPVVQPITLQQLLGQNGLVVDVPGIATVTLGSKPHAIGGAPATAPTIASDGTSAAAAVDAVRLSLLQLVGLNTLDLRVGHMEGAVTVPSGGVKCNIPVAKSSNPATISAGDDFTISISIPSDATFYNTLFGCDLVNISAVDVHTVTNGNVSFTLTGASNNGVINDAGDTVTWDNLGSYKRGDPPIVLTVTGHIPSNSAAGTLEDTATVSATLGNCLGGAVDGQDIVGSAVTGGKVTGTRVFDVEVTRTGVLPSTGGDGRLLVLGGILLLTALAVQRRVRKPAAKP